MPANLRQFEDILTSVFYSLKHEIVARLRAVRAIVLCGLADATMITAFG